MKQTKGVSTHSAVRLFWYSLGLMVFGNLLKPDLFVKEIIITLGSVGLLLAVVIGLLILTVSAARDIPLKKKS